MKIKKELILKNLLDFKESKDVYADVKVIIDSAKNQAYQSINVTLVIRNWLLGMRIANETLKGNSRAEYGLEVINNVSLFLTKLYGKGYNNSSIYRYVKFYKYFPNLLDYYKSKTNIVLSWSHYRILLQVEDDKARYWYENESINETWSVRTLQRNVSSQYYYRLLSSQNKNEVKKEIIKNTSPYKMDKYEFIKNPIITEFLGLSNETSFTETSLETAIIDNF